MTTIDTSMEVEGMAGRRRNIFPVSDTVSLVKRVSKVNTVVSDSGPLIHLSQIGRLYLLKEFFGEVLIPPAVYREVVIEGRGRPGSREVKEAQWIRVVEIRDKRLKNILQLVLDEGESEAIVLALETNANLVLLDDREARIQAKKLRLHVAGTLGILLRAKRLGLVESLREELNKLKDAGFRISKNLEEELLKIARE